MKKSGFTLAEVLITLGVLGIVIAMTLPALMQNYKRKEYSTKLKKFYSVMQQAFVRSEYDNGPAGEWLKGDGDIKGEDGHKDYGANSKVIEDWFKTYLSPYIQHSSFETGNSDWKFGELKVVFNDGTTLFLHNGNCIDFNVDLNGDKGANSYGVDTFWFLLCPDEKCKKQTWNDTCGKLMPWSMSPKSREKVLTNCKTSAKNCSALLYMDNFEFKSDYPYRVK